MNPTPGPGIVLDLGQVYQGPYCGFLFAAENRIARAIESFDAAIAIDGALGNAGLGRGLAKIRRGDVAAGIEDLQVAATLEPQRSVLRSYLGKGYTQAPLRLYSMNVVRERWL